MIKLFEKSPLELLCYPLTLVPVVRKAWTVVVEQGESWATQDWSFKPPVKTKYVVSKVDLRQPGLYEHILTPLVTISLIRLALIAYSFFQSKFPEFLPILPYKSILWGCWYISILWHLVLKEMIVDPLIYKRPWSWSGIVERLYGCALGAVGVI